MSNDQTSSALRSIRVLSLDGGGIRGLSTLLVLRALMIRVARSTDPYAVTPALPYQHFDLIVGTSTGGLIALMLGRLRMGIDASIEAYVKLAKNVFESPRFTNYTYSGKTLRAEMQQIVATVTQDPKAILLDQSNVQSETGRTVVVAMREVNLRGVPHLFRSYISPSSAGNTDQCTIWEAARATTAASTFFKPITINRSSYIDGAMGLYNNPAELALNEAEKMWPGREIGLLLSIGTGVQGPIHVSVLDLPQ